MDQAMIPTPGGAVGRSGRVLHVVRYRTGTCQCHIFTVVTVHLTPTITSLAVRTSSTSQSTMLQTRMIPSYYDTSKARPLTDKRKMTMVL